MAFIDWNNNGDIDDEDIAIGIALIESEEDEDQTPQRHKSLNPDCGCLPVVLFSTVIISSTIIAGILFLVSV